MLKDKELKKLRSALPDGSYQKIAEELNIHKETARRCLTFGDMYRKDVIDAALLIIEEAKADLETQKEKIKSI